MEKQSLAWCVDTVTDHLPLFSNRKQQVQPSTLLLSSPSATFLEAVLFFSSPIDAVMEIWQYKQREFCRSCKSSVHELPARARAFANPEGRHGVIRPEARGAQSLPRRANGGSLICTAGFNKV